MCIVSILLPFITIYTISKHLQNMIKLKVLYKAAKVKNTRFTLLDLGKKLLTQKKILKYDMREKIFKLFVPSHFITDFNKIWWESLQQEVESCHFKKVSENWPKPS